MKSPQHNNTEIENHEHVLICPQCDKTPTELGYTPTQSIEALIIQGKLSLLEDLKTYDWVGNDDQGREVEVNDLVIGELNAHKSTLQKELEANES